MLLANANSETIIYNCTSFMKKGDAWHNLQICHILFDQLVFVTTPTPAPTPHYLMYDVTCQLYKYCHKFRAES